MSTADIIRKLCEGYGLDTDVDVESEIKPFRLQRNFTDYEYLQNLRNEHNCYLWGNKKTIYFKKEANASKDEIILENGKTLLSFHGNSQSSRLFTELVVRGRNPNNLEFIESTANASLVKKKIGGNTASPEYLEDRFSKHREYYTDYSIKDRKGAEEKAARILEQNSMEYIRFTGECQGDPKIKAGMTITIKGMGEIYSGEYFLKQVEHELRSMTGYITTFDAVRNARNVKKGAGLATEAGVRLAKKEERGKLVKSVVKLMLNIDPNDPATADDKYTLFSTDRQYSKTLTPNDDTETDDDVITLEFEGVIEGLNYSLEIDLGSEGEKYLLFEDVPFELLEDF